MNSEGDYDTHLWQGIGAVIAIIIVIIVLLLTIATGLALPIRKN